MLAALLAPWGPAMDNRAPGQVALKSPSNAMEYCHQDGPKKQNLGLWLSECVLLSGAPGEQVALGLERIAGLGDWLRSLGLAERAGGVEAWAAQSAAGGQRRAGVGRAVSGQCFECCRALRKKCLQCVESFQGRMGSIQGCSHDSV